MLFCEDGEGWWSKAEVEHAAGLMDHDEAVRSLRNSQDYRAIIFVGQKWLLCTVPSKADRPVDTRLIKSQFIHALPLLFIFYLGSLFLVYCPISVLSFERQYPRAIHT